MQRQPISTAPKDGTWVLVGGGVAEIEVGNDEVLRRDPKRPVVAKWITRWDGSEGRWVYANWDGAWRSSYKKPSWWVDLEKGPLPVGRLLG